MCGDPKLASVSRIVWEARKNDSAIVCKAGSGFARRRPGSAPSSRAGFGSRSTSLDKTLVSLRTMKNDLMVDTRQKGRRGNPLAVGVSTASAPRFSIVLAETHALERSF